MNFLNRFHLHLIGDKATEYDAQNLNKLYFKKDKKGNQFLSRLSESFSNY
jgi:hypothetical protein